MRQADRKVDDRRPSRLSRVPQEIRRRMPNVGDGP